MRITSIVSKFLEFSLGKSTFLALVLFSSSLSYARVTNVEDLTLEEKVGQILILGFRGTKLDQNLQVKLQNLKPGGVIFFKKNISTLPQLKELNQSIQKASSVPVLTMLDQEGGNVSRLPLPFVPPSAWSLAQPQDLKYPRTAGRWTGELLKDLGIHLNLAPVYDISAQNSFSFLGTRVFSHDVKLGSLAANAFSDGLIRADVIPTAKHFPGHGLARGDSHKVLAEADSSQELESFKSFFAIEGTKAVMMAHVAYPNLDPSGTPASLSYPIVTELLREKMQFDGIVMTDDLEMYGVSHAGPLGERVVQAFEAGCDMIMIAWSESAQKLAYKSLLNAVRSGRISEDRLNASVGRILKAKNSVIREVPTYNYPLALNRLERLTRKVAKTNFNQTDFLLPEKFEEQKIEKVVVLTSDSRFHQEFKDNWKKTPVSFYKIYKGVDLSPLNRKPTDKLYIFYATGPGSAKVLNSLPKSLRARTVVVNAAHPDSIGNKKDFFAIYQMNTPFYESAKWLAQKLDNQTNMRVAEVPNF